MSKEDNLIPITSETAKELGAKGGRNKAGSKHISTHIQEMLNDPDFELKLKDGTILKGRPMQAIIKTAVAKAVSGDMRAFDMLAKHGYGTKLTIEVEDPVDKILKGFGLKDDGQTSGDAEASPETNA